MPTVGTQGIQAGETPPAEAQHIEGRELRRTRSWFHGGCAANLSELARDRLSYQPRLPASLLHDGPLAMVDGSEREMAHHCQAFFPNLCSARRMVHLEAATPDTQGATQLASTPQRVGVVLSGGQAPGGHNVIVGISDHLHRFAPGSTLLGFANGPKGICTCDARELSERELALYRNQGGFHLLGSGRDKIEKPEQLEAASQTCRELDLDGLVIIGGDDSNTNAAVLAEHFLANGVKTRVVGVPKTIDGDLKNADVAISFGFDTAAKVYSQLVGDIMVDAASAKKYYHFVRLMGRAASHLTLEVALQTHPQLALISEEVASRRLSLRDITHQVADVVMARAMNGRHYGVILIPEGLVEHVHDMAELISELNELMAQGMCATDIDAIVEALTPSSAALFAVLPPGIRSELLEDRDPHGNVQVSHIEMEKLLIRLVEVECNARKEEGRFSGKLNALSHFFGYEGRCTLPSNFDATYTYSLGHAAAALIAANKTGLMATVSNLQRPVGEWCLGGTPLVSMMHLERRSGKDKLVVHKALVDLDGPVMQAYCALRDHWALHDCYRSPGPIQYHGHLYSDMASYTLALELNGGTDILLERAPSDSSGSSRETPEPAREAQSEAQTPLRPDPAAADCSGRAAAPPAAHSAGAQCSAEHSSSLEALAAA